MPEQTFGRENEIDATTATAHLPGLDIDISRSRSPNGDWEQISINLRATPSFEGVGRVFAATDPLTLWVHAVRLMWMPWLLAAQPMIQPADHRTRTLPGVGPD